MTIETETLDMTVGSRGIGRSGSSSQTRAVVDPARNVIIATVPEATESEVDEAVTSARAAFRSGVWRDLSPTARGDALMAIATVIRAESEDLAQLESLNVGKPIVQARGDIEQAADFFDYFGRVIVDLPDEVIENSPQQMTIVVREAVGVVAAIVPWNFPLTVAAASVAPALAAGNAIVLKPSELTPLTALRLGQLARDILPAGVFSVITGDGPGVGACLASHSDVQRIVFTGSTATGANIMQTASKSMKRTGLELGGKSPTIVLENAPVDNAAQSALRRITLNQGENCAAGSRLLIHRRIYDEIAERIVTAARSLRIGDPQHNGTDLGPMISVNHRAKVQSYMEVASREARPLYIGSIPDTQPLSDGFFVPLSLWETKPDGRVWREEVFGPLLVVTPFDDEEEAISLANDSDYGLLATVWSGDRGRALSLARKLEVGIVRINKAISPLNGPWGGMKLSGIGRGYGRYAIEESTELKQISIDLS